MRRLNTELITEWDKEGRDDCKDIVKKRSIIAGVKREAFTAERENGPQALFLILTAMEFFNMTSLFKW